MTKIDSAIPVPADIKPGPKRPEVQNEIIAKAVADTRYRTPYMKAKVYLQEYKQVGDPTFSTAVIDAKQLRTEIGNFASLIRAAINAAPTN